MVRCMARSKKQNGEKAPGKDDVVRNLVDGRARPAKEIAEITEPPSRTESLIDEIVQSGLRLFAFICRCSFTIA